MVERVCDAAVFDLEDLELLGVGVLACHFFVLVGWFFIVLFDCYNYGWDGSE